MTKNYQLSIINYQSISKFSILKLKSLKKSLSIDHCSLVIPQLFESGLTLIEIMVALTILAIVGTVAIPNFRQFNSDQEITNTTSNLIKLLQQTQVSSQSQIACINSLPLNTNNPAIFWDLKISDATHYQLQAECINGATGVAAGTTVYETATLTNVNLGVTSNPGGVNCAFPAIIQFYTTTASLSGTNPPLPNGRVVSLTCNGTDVPGLTQVILNISQPGFTARTVTIEANGVAHQ